MKLCFLGVWCVTVSLTLISCSDEKISPVSSAELAELHGSAVHIAEHLNPIPEDEPPFINSPSFQRYFKRLGRIELSDDVLIGEFSSLQISPSGRLLIHDRTGHDVFLFEPDGRLVRTLSSEGCDPGLPWKPEGAVFSPTGEIFVTNNRNRDVLFNADGFCTRLVDRGLVPSRSTVLTESGDLFALVTQGSSGRYIQHFDIDGIARPRIAESNEFSVILPLLIAGGLAQDDTGRLYLGLPVGAQISVFDTSGTDLGRVGTAPEYFRPIERDLPDNHARRAIFGVMETSSSIVAISLLDTDTLILFIRNGFEDYETSEKTIGLHVMSTSGETLTSIPILLSGYKTMLLGARDGLLYRATYPDVDSDDDGNQSLIVYRFVGESI